MCMDLDKCLDIEDRAKLISMSTSSRTTCFLSGGFAYPEHMVVMDFGKDQTDKNSVEGQELCVNLNRGLPQQNTKQTWVSKYLDVHYLNIIPFFLKNFSQSCISSNTLKANKFHISKKSLFKSRSYLKLDPHVVPNI